MLFVYSIVFSAILKIFISAQDNSKRPHIIFIVADDLGWHDISWHNPSVKTPSLDHFARTGIILNQSYVAPLCTPSRNAILTGLYPYHTGLQHYVITMKQNASVPLNVKLLPEYLRHAGYATHMVGKWHLGHCRWEMTPRHRGFDTFYGYYGGEESYYWHSVTECKRGYPWLDFRDNETPNWRDVGNYSTYLFVKRATEIIAAHPPSKPLFLYLPFQNVHKPLDVPEEFESRYAQVKDDNRRKLLGLTAALDDAFANVTHALSTAGLLSDSIIVFTSDNGGLQVENAGVNWPLRGAKYTLFEGGTRAVGFIWGPFFLPDTGFESNQLFHAVDWLPTLTAFAGINPKDHINYLLDGYDSRAIFKRDGVSPRTEFVYNIDEINNGMAIRMGDWKLIAGDPGSFNGWYPAPEDPVAVGQACPAPVHQRRPQKSHKMPQQQQSQPSHHTADLKFELHTEHAPGHSLNNMGENHVHDAHMATEEKLLELDEHASTLSAACHLNSNAPLYEPSLVDFERHAHVHSLVNCLHLDPHRLYFEHRDDELYLFNIKDDPAERLNLANQPEYRERLLSMLDRLKFYMQSLVPSQSQKRLHAADPRFWNGTWTPGWC